MARKAYKYPPLQAEEEFSDCQDCYRLKGDFDKTGLEPGVMYAVGGFATRQMGHLLYHSREGRVRLCQAKRKGIVIPQVW